MDIKCTACGRAITHIDFTSDDFGNYCNGKCRMNHDSERETDEFERIAELELFVLGIAMQQQVGMDVHGDSNMLIRLNRKAKSLVDTNQPDSDE